MSELRVDSVKSKGGGAPDLPKGVTISGITTAATLGATIVDVSNVNVSGVVTSGTLNGPLLSTGTPTLGLGVTINSSGLAISGVATAGIVSATTLYGDGSNLTGIGASIAPLFYNPDVYDRTVTVGTGIGITFNQQIKAGSGNINLRLVSIGGTIVEAFGVGSSVTISENRLSFDPASDLDQNTIYCVDVPGTAFTNNEGTAYVGTAYTFQSKFTFRQLWAWGGNTFGELYLAGVTGGEPARRSSPVQIPGLTWKDLANMAGKTTYQSMASKTDGTLWLWGRNQYGSIGNSTPAASYQSSPIQIPGTNWTGTYDTMSCGYSTTRAIKTNGEMWSWGYNGSGNSGVNNRTHYSSPVQVPGTTWAVTAGTSYAEYAIRTDGTLWSWGYNVQGALGLNQPHPTKISSPTQVPGTTWSKISCGERNAFALKTDGTFWVWGRNETGWLGLNEGANPGPSKSSPCQIPGTTWTSNYAVTLQGALAIKTDGTLWSWGKNNWGSLGHNNETNYSSPTQVGSETTWSSVKVGGAYKVRAIKTDGTLWSWGYNNQGQLGDNSTVHRSSPVQVGSDTTWSKIGGTGAKTSYAIKNIEG